MNISSLPSQIENFLMSSLDDLSLSDNEIGFWEVSDYGIFVMLSEKFYKTLNYRKAEPLDFINRLALKQLPHTDAYSDSREYMSITLDHFETHGLSPIILDIGGYIGRFSLESALLMKGRGLNIPICCFEPGLSGNIIRANLEVNQVSEYVRISNLAASGKDGEAEYKYSPDVLITGRINAFPNATKSRTVKTVRLDQFLEKQNSWDAAIIKIDTEGHEPDVMTGLGKTVFDYPMLLIVEFWPATLKSLVNGVPYAEFINENFYVINIKNSLYPKFYEIVTDVELFGKEFDFSTGNVDLLFINKLMPDAFDLVSKLTSLSV